MIVAYTFDSHCGAFSIRLTHDGRWAAMYEDEDLGHYASPRQALDDLSGGHTFSPSSGIDTADCGLPDDLSEWETISR